MTRTLPVSIAYGKVTSVRTGTGRWQVKVGLNHLAGHPSASESEKVEVRLDGWEERYQDSLTCCVKRIKHAMSGKGERDFSG